MRYLGSRRKALASLSRVGPFAEIVDDMARLRTPSQLSRSVFESLLDFLDHREHLEAILVAATDCDPTSSVRAFSVHVANKSGIDVDIVFRVLRVLSNTARSAEVTKELPEELVRELTEAIHKNSKWSEEQIGQWVEVKDRLVDAVSQIGPDSPLMISAKANFLTYERQNVLHQTRIITDIRPVFDKAAETIREMIVTHTLVVNYSGGGNPTELHLALDRTDIETLREQCDRADVKSQRLLTALEDTPWPTITYPESEEE
ncbi:MAG: hypothetical protein IID44_08260 [Planctomycetes bacterium]|nr:hypothetical protein [Planctomycetota bacterium]